MAKKEKELRVKRPLLDRIMDGVERVGNNLPDPITMFLALAVIVVIVSAICSAAGVSAINPADGEKVEVFNLFSVAGIQYLWNNVITNFSGFAPLGMVLVAILGSSVAEKSGFLSAVMERLLGKSKGWVVTAVVLFVGYNMNIAGDSGFIIFPPLVAILFMSIGRSPILGLFVAYASVAGGLAASCLLTISDALAYSFTEPAAQMVDPSYAGSVAINWYFLAASAVIMTVVGTILVEKLLVHRFPVTEKQLEEYGANDRQIGLSDVQKKGLGNAGIALLLYGAVIVLMCIPFGGKPGMLANEAGSLTASDAPLTRGIVFTVALALMVPGIAYGVTTGRYKKDRDVWADVSQGYSEMGNYIFMCFCISIFTSFFSVSKLGSIIAIKGAAGLESIGFTGIPLLIALILLSCVVNMFIGSASAKWAILAPIFVPMTMMMGINPAMTQVVYRIGDSITNPLSPLFTYMPIILGFVRKYQKEAGFGTIVANMLPFSVAYTLAWIVQVILWAVLEIPLGPGAGVYL